MADIYRWIKKHRTKLSGFLAVVFLIFARPTPKILFYGLPFIILGESLRIWSSGHIHKNEILTETGPYSLSRNPLYLGSFILGSGFIVGMGVLWLAVVYLLFFTTVYWFTIKWEEEKLRGRFPEEWEAYTARVSRFVPLGRIPKYRGGEFSWSQVIKHREPANASIVLVVYLILWAKAVFLGG